MPHIIIAEYSANLGDHLDVPDLIADLHQAAIVKGVAELPGIRTRTARRENFRVADGNPANGLVHIVARPRVGRSEEQRRKLGQLLFEAADRRPIGLTAEIHEIDQLTFRRNTFRETMPSAA